VAITEKMSDAYKKMSGIIEKIFDTLLFVFFTGMFITVLIQITARFVPGWVVIWTEELTMLFYFYIIGFGAPMAVKYGMYARVDIIFMVVPLRVRLFLEALASVLVIVFFVGLIFASWPLIALGGQRLSFAMQIPYVIFLVSMPILAITSAIASVGRTIYLINDFIHPERVLQREREATERQARENEELAATFKRQQVIPDSGSDGGSKA